MGENAFIYFIALFFPMAVLGEGTRLGDLRGPVERHPAGDAGEKEILPAASYFPDAVIGLVPVLAQPVHLLLQRLPEIIRDGVPILIEQIYGIHQLAVDIQLQLRIGVIADANGSAALIARETSQVVFSQLPAAVQGIHDAQSLLAIYLVADLFDPGHKSAGLL